MKRRILLADDSVTIQKVIELTFMDEADVTSVSNGDEAVAALSRFTPDLVLADVHMPGVNGYEVCRRSKESHPSVPVLLLVGTFEPFDEARSREVGADSFLKKPFDSQELLQLAARLMTGSAGPAPAPAAAEQPAAAESAVWAEETQQPGALSAFSAEGGTEPIWSSLQLEPEPEPETELAEAAAPLYGEPVESQQEPDPFRWEVEPEALAPEPFAEQELGYEPRPIGFRSHETRLEEGETPAAVPPASEAVAAETTGGGQPVPLSDADVDRIARRVAELLGDRAVRDVAWEVIPDMAEVVIKERIRELESQVS